jgi:hypothetical protein
MFNRCFILGTILTFLFVSIPFYCTIKKRFSEVPTPESNENIQLISNTISTSELFFVDIVPSEYPNRTKILAQDKNCNLYVVTYVEKREHKNKVSLEETVFKIPIKIK